jgi:hypothetical protein
MAEMMNLWFFFLELLRFSRSIQMEKTSLGVENEGAKGKWVLGGGASAVLPLQGFLSALGTVLHPPFSF